MNSYDSKRLRRQIQDLLILEYTKGHDVQDSQTSPAMTRQLTDLEEKIKSAGLSYPEYNQIISGAAGGRQTIYNQIKALAKLTTEKFPKFPLLALATNGEFSIKKPTNLQKFMNAVKEWKGSDKEPKVQHQGLLSDPDNNPYYTYLKTEDVGEFDANKAPLVYYASKEKSTGGTDGDRAEDALVAYYNVLGQAAESVQGKAPGRDITIAQYVIELKTAKHKGEVTGMLNTSAIKPDIDKFYYFVSGRGSDDNVVHIVNAMLLYVRNLGILLDVKTNADGELEFDPSGFEKKIRKKVQDELKNQNFEDVIVQTLLSGRPNEELEVKRSFGIGGLNVRFKLDFAIKQTDAASDIPVASADPEEVAAAIYASLLQTPAQAEAGRIGESVSSVDDSLDAAMIKEQDLRRLVLELLARKLKI